jgi:multidrug efflux pump subunit AcrB
MQETPHLDFVRSYASPGLTTIFVNLKGATPASAVPDIWYHVRKSVGDMRGTLPAGVIGPGFNDEFGEPSASFAVSPLTASPSDRAFVIHGDRARLVTVQRIRKGQNGGCYAIPYPPA